MKKRLADIVAILSEAEEFVTECEAIVEEAARQGPDELDPPPDL